MDGPVEVLLQPYDLSAAIELPNRIVMAPMTRSMAGPGLVVTHASAEYYARRASAGLLISEGTIIRPDGQGYPDVPGIFTDVQIEGWREVATRVHEKDGRIFLQLWHVGRISHPNYLSGDLPVAPSAVPLSGRIPRAKALEYGVPRALENTEINDIVSAFGTSAANAIGAGADGVEIHGANGYLIDQFLHHHTNRRDDAWGGSPARMCRFALEVVDAVVDAAGSDRVGIRLSPGAYFNQESHPDDAGVYKLLLEELSGRSLAYVHVGIFDHSIEFEHLGGTAEAFIRRHYQGTLIGCGSYDPTSAARSIDTDAFDLIAFGRPFIANPDLVERIRDGSELAPYDEGLLKRLD